MVISPLSEELRQCYRESLLFLSLQSYCITDVRDKHQIAYLKFFPVSSGIVVLAFGSSTVDQPDGNILYDASSVFLYDTNSNELYKQNISGTPPKSRASTNGVLGNK
jgi:hypothetical protein